MVKGLPFILLVRGTIYTQADAEMQRSLMVLSGKIHRPFSLVHALGLPKHTTHYCLHPYETVSSLGFNKIPGTSLVAQWLRIRLPMQGTWVRALVREDPTCHGATKPVSHNY